MRSAHSSSDTKVSAPAARGLGGAEVERELAGAGRPGAGHDPSGGQLYPIVQSPRLAWQRRHSVGTTASLESLRSFVLLDDFEKALSFVATQGHGDGRGDVQPCFTVGEMNPPPERHLRNDTGRPVVARVPLGHQALARKLAHTEPEARCSSFARARSRPAGLGHHLTVTTDRSLVVYPLRRSTCSSSAWMRYRVPWVQQWRSGRSEISHVAGDHGHVVDQRGGGNQGITI